MKNGNFYITDFTSNIEIPYESNFIWSISKRFLYFKNTEQIILTVNNKFPNWLSLMNYLIINYIRYFLLSTEFHPLW